MIEKKLNILIRYVLPRMGLLLVVLCLAVPAVADETYSGDFLTRSTLTGGWGA